MEFFMLNRFPDCLSHEPALTLDEWTSGKNCEPKLEYIFKSFLLFLININDIVIETDSRK